MLHLHEGQSNLILNAPFYVTNSTVRDALWRSHSYPASFAFSPRSVSPDPIPVSFNWSSDTILFMSWDEAIISLRVLALPPIVIIIVNQTVRKMYKYYSLCTNRPISEGFSKQYFYLIFQNNITKICNLQFIFEIQFGVIIEFILGNPPISRHYIKLN